MKGGARQFALQRGSISPLRGFQIHDRFQSFFPEAGTYMKRALISRLIILTIGKYFRSILLIPINT
jgi:hypothetical protein